MINSEIIGGNKKGKKLLKFKKIQREKKMYGPIELKFDNTPAIVIGDTPLAVTWVKQLLYYGCQVRLVAKEIPFELRNLRNLELDSKEAEWIGRGEQVVAIDTGDSLLDIYLALSFKEITDCLIITAFPTLYTNARLPKINDEKIDHYLDEYLRTGRRFYLFPDDFISPRKDRPVNRKSPGNFLRDCKISLEEQV